MINKLIADIQKKQAPIVVGLDPTLKLIPDIDSNHTYRLLSLSAY